VKNTLLSLLLFLQACGKAPEHPPVVLQNYDSLKQEIIAQREIFKKDYLAANGREKDSIVALSRDYLFGKITNDIFAQWYGTPWSFYGNTRIPKTESIACGYFVTTALSDAGFNIPRTAWAQLASETFIVKMTGDLKRFSNKPINDVAGYVKKRGNGLYIVGLDCHVGFIYVNGDEVKFVHSSYYHPEIGVMAEDFNTKNPLKASKYRILGKLLDDDMMQKWMVNSRYQ
jgi:hypothetical protein